MRPSVLAAASALVLAATTLAACGGVDKQAYVQDVTNLQRKTSSDAALRSSEMAKAKTPAAIAKELKALGTSIETNATALGKIEAPSEVEGLHKQYVDLMVKYGNDLEALSTRVSKADAETTNDLLKSASSLTSTLATSEQKIVQNINTELQ